MTAKHKIMKRILEYCRVNMEFNGKDTIQWDLTPENIDWFWSEVDDKCEGLLQEVKEEYRRGDFITADIPAPPSRHYESRSVAAKMEDGSFVGWTYWYGGGKHGEPEAIPWMEDAYELEMTEEEKVVVVRKFKKKEQI